MLPSFDTVGDAMPKGQIYGTREKYIHTVGSTVQIKLETVKNPFTGMFQGSDTGFIRMSTAAPADAKTPNSIPGFGLKLLRDGMDSANLVSMYGLEGQDSCNYFANTFSNHVPTTTSPPLLVLGKKFATVTNYVYSVGLSEMASYDQKGNAVKDVKFPFQLFWEPNTDLTTDSCTNDMFSELE